MRNRRAETIVLCSALFLFVVFSVLQSTAKRTQSSSPSTYDSGARGYAALYEFLQRERVDASRFENPFGMLRAGGTLVVAGDYAIDSFFSGKNSASLDAWVRKGGHLIVLGALFPGERDALGLPRSFSAASSLGATACGFSGKRLTVAGDFAAAMRVKCARVQSALVASRTGALVTMTRRGRGWIVYAVSPSLFDNAHLALRDNAALAYDVFAAGSPPQFDEYIYGYGNAKSFWQVLPQPVLAGVAVALFALLLAVIGANIRLTPPRRVAREDRRDSFAYIESLARMLQRGLAGRDAVARLEKAASALRAPAAADEDGRRALAELRALRQQYDVSAADVLRAGVIFHRLRKEYE